ncbi:MAG: YfcE family phosphodiesterase [Candidatus Altiarchaeia archaeon]
MRTDSVPAYCPFWGKTMLVLLKAFEEHSRGALKGTDPEDIHQTRVASRRLLTVLSLFPECLPGKKRKIWAREIRKAAKALSSARDLDVQATRIEDYLKGSPMNIGPAILLEKNREERKCIQDAVRDAIKDIDARNVIEDIRRTCKKTIEKTNGAPGSGASYAPAGMRICVMVDDLLSYECPVHKESDIDAHHKMRITAKRLRYALETYAGIYGKESCPGASTIKHLRDVVEISEYTAYMKRLQEILGEMHDYDVLINRVDEYKYADKDDKKDQKAIGKSLAAFRQYLEESRAFEYKRLVSFWEDAREKKTFESIKELIDPFSPQKKRIAVLSDIHGNIHALKAVLEDARNNGVELFLNAGDLTGYGAFPNEVIEELAMVPSMSVIGNYDQKVLERTVSGKKKKGAKETMLDYNAENISGRTRKYLAKLPKELRIKRGKKNMLIVHASPLSDSEGIVAQKTGKMLGKIEKPSGADIIITGHTHRQFHKIVEDVVYINPGTVGIPYDRDNRAMYALLSIDPPDVEMKRIPYDYKLAVDGGRKKGIPEKVCQALLRAESLDTIEEEEERLPLERGNTNQFIEMVRKTKQRYETDAGHEKQVRRLTLKLFDDLKDMHGIGIEGRTLLECATILHDIGWTLGGKGHNKNSMKLILNDTRLPFTSEERVVVGSIARYHCKKIPSEDYGLEGPAQRETLMLAGIMRIADGLDASHSAAVQNIKAKTDKRRITIECTAYGNTPAEERASAEKKDLLEKISGKQVLINWKRLPAKAKPAS